ncbi:hypothetical protein DPMN_155098 [Dreissena polymorpha]|uniref:Uncharacterized protein n=1 Tax=Dreissena polymorpha TaxID=45954 RepID=A0A9D4FN99_DREPO|nr:hypothetical protein DPMN_155098 [Dreissena polymorpha]
MPAAASPNGYLRGESNWMRNRRLGGPNNNLMPNGKLGIPTPTRDCVLSWNDFLTHVRMLCI